MDPELTVGQAIRVSGGKYNGFEGTIAKLGDTAGSIVIQYEGRTHEVVVDLIHLLPLQAWIAGKSTTELALRGHAS